MAFVVVFPLPQAVAASAAAITRHHANELIDSMRNRQLPIPNRIPNLAMELSFEISDAGAGLGGVRQ
jgi:hypothetical protein